MLLAGFSFGGAVALRASGAVEFEQLVLMAPGFRRFTREGMGEPPDPQDAGLGAPGRHTQANTYIVHGDRDETVRIVKLPPRRAHYDLLATGEEIRRSLEARIDARDADPLAP